MITLEQYLEEKELTLEELVQKLSKVNYDAWQNFNKPIDTGNVEAVREDAIKAVLTAIFDG